MKGLEVINKSARCVSAKKKGRLRFAALPERNKSPGGTSASAVGLRSGEPHVPSNLFRMKTSKPQRKDGGGRHTFTK